VATLNTLKNIRRRAGRLSGDMLLCTATSNGSTTTFTDALNLNHEQSILLNRHGYLSGGTAANLGRSVRVTANVKSTQTLTFTPALPSDTAISDEMELWNERDEGVTPAAANEVINDAIRDVTENTPLPVTSDEFTFAASSPVIAVDDLEVDAVVDGTNWELITGVDWEDDSGIWRPIQSADIRVDRYARTVEILNRPRWNADGLSVRVRGANLATVLTSDSSTTAVNFQWLTHYAAAGFLALRLEKAYDRRDVEGRMLNLQAKAEQYAPRLQLSLSGRRWRLS
jgi:hypothetical protein